MEKFRFFILLACAALVPLSSLAESGPVGSAYTCVTDEKTCFQSGVDQFSEHFLNQKKVVPEFREPSLPYLWTQGGPTPYSILLIHGLTDSPYSMRDLGKAFFDQGMNVVSVLLPGHGTTVEDLMKVDLMEWKREVDFGLQVASLVGRKVLVAGYSTGGALAIQLAYTRPNQVAGYFLFGPAIRFHSWMGNLSCVVHHWKKFREDHPEEILEDDPTRYNKMPVHAICQLKKLMEQNMMISRVLEIDVPVFAAASDLDDAVDVDRIKRFKQFVRGPWEYFGFTKSDQVEHGSLTRSDENPHYQRLEDAVVGFFEKNFPDR